MNRKWIIPLSAAVAAGLVAYGVTRNTLLDQPHPTLDRLQDISFLTQQLGLTQAQVTEIRNLHTTFGSELNDCCSRHCAARARLGDVLTSETNGAAQAEAVISEMCRAYEQSERAALNHVRAVRALLTAEQKKRFDAMITSCMCRSCSRNSLRRRESRRGVDRY